MKRSRRLLTMLFPILWPQAGLSQPTGVNITIVCDEHASCRADPPFFVLESQQTVKVSSQNGPWKCSVYWPDAPSPAMSAESDPATGSNDANPTPCGAASEFLDTAGRPALIFEQGKSKVVVPVFYTQPKQPDSENAEGAENLAWPGAAAVMMLLLAALSIWKWRIAESAQAVLASTAGQFERDVKTRCADIDRLAQTLQFAELPQRGRSQSPMRTNDGVSQTAGLQKELLNGLTRWSKLSPTVPPEIRRGSDDLQRADQISASELQNIGETMAQVAVRTVDDPFDPIGQHNPLGKATEDLVRAAGLTLIHPKEGDPFDDNRHSPSPINERPPSPQWKKRIASVRRRGLERNGVIVAKADVKIYD